MQFLGDHKRRCNLLRPPAYARPDLPPPDVPTVPYNPNQIIPVPVNVPTTEQLFTYMDSQISRLTNMFQAYNPVVSEKQTNFKKLFRPISHAVLLKTPRTWRWMRNHRLLNKNKNLFSLSKMVYPTMAVAGIRCNLTCFRMLRVIEGMLFKLVYNKKLSKN